MKHLFAKSHDFDVHKYIRLLGIIAILIFVVTQAIESLGFVHECIYCRTIRTCIGLIGVIMLLPLCPIFSRLFTLVIAYLGAHVAAAGIFMNIQRATYFNEFTVLAAMAMIILALQVMVVMYCCKNEK